jgi:hypothetical protein
MKADPKELEILEYLHGQHPNTLKLLIGIRRHLLSFLPTHQENLRMKTLAYDRSLPQAPYKHNICTLHPHGMAVRLTLPMGGLVKDPKHLLQGLSQIKRFIDFTRTKEFESPFIRDILLQSYDFDPLRLPSTLSGTETCQLPKR